MQAAALYRSTIGKKALMAITGFVWIGYVIMHMYGNLKVFTGPEHFNAYAEGLRDIGAPVFGHLHLLTVARVALVASIVIHVWAATVLYARALSARPTTYATRKVVQANYPALTMRYGGLLIFLFVLFHLMQLTWGVPGVSTDFIAGDPYHNVLQTFRSWPVVVIYLLALLALGFHLFHGTWSMFQTLGFNNDEWDGLIRGLAWLIAIVVPVGFAVVPVAVQFGMLQ